MVQPSGMHTRPGHHRHAKGGAGNQRLYQFITALFLIAAVPWIYGLFRSPSSNISAPNNLHVAKVDRYTWPNLPSVDEFLSSKSSRSLKLEQPTDDSEREAASFVTQFCAAMHFATKGVSDRDSTADHLAKAYDEWQAFLSHKPDYRPKAFRGKGIVITGEGMDALVDTWISLRMLRYVGSTLPMEIWLPDDQLPSQSIREAFLSHGARIRSLGAFATGDELKRCLGEAHTGQARRMFAVALSSFEEVLLLDQSQLAVLNPDAVFATHYYNDTGATLWRTFEVLSPRSYGDARKAFHLDKPEVDSWVGKNSGSYPGAYHDTDIVPEGGERYDAHEFTWRRVHAEHAKQRSVFAHDPSLLVVHKRRLWAPLLFSLYMHSRPEVYHTAVTYPSKPTNDGREVFAMALRVLRVPYYLVPTPPGIVGREAGGGATYVQHRPGSTQAMFINRQCLDLRRHTFTNETRQWTTLIHLLPGVGVTDRPVIPGSAERCGVNVINAHGIVREAFRSAIPFDVEAMAHRLGREMAENPASRAAQAVKEELGAEGKTEVEVTAAHHEGQVGETQAVLQQQQQQQQAEGTGGGDIAVTTLDTTATATAKEQEQGQGQADQGKGQADQGKGQAAIQAQQEQQQQQQADGGGARRGRRRGGLWRRGAKSEGIRRFFETDSGEVKRETANLLELNSAEYRKEHAWELDTALQDLSLNAELGVDELDRALDRELWEYRRKASPPPPKRPGDQTEKDAASGNAGGTDQVDESTRQQQLDTASTLGTADTQVREKKMEEQQQGEAQEEAQARTQTDPQQQAGGDQQQQQQLPLRRGRRRWSFNDHMGALKEAAHHQKSEDDQSLNLFQHDGQSEYVAIPKFHLDPETEAFLDRQERIMFQIFEEELRDKLKERAALQANATAAGSNSTLDTRELDAAIATLRRKVRFGRLKEAQRRQQEEAAGKLARKVGDSGSDAAVDSDLTEAREGTAEQQGKAAEGMTATTEEKPRVLDLGRKVAAGGQAQAIDGKFQGGRGRDEKVLDIWADGDDGGVGRQRRLQT